MAGGGVGTGQDKTILSSTFAVDVMAMTSSLQRYGVSYAGAQAFASGQPVASMADRKALASLFSDALAHLRTR
jgi:hypothetical protein